MVRRARDGVQRALRSRWQAIVDDAEIGFGLGQPHVPGAQPQRGRAAHHGIETGIFQPVAMDHAQPEHPVQKGQSGIRVLNRPGNALGFADQPVTHGGQIAEQGGIARDQRADHTIRPPQVGLLIAALGGVVFSDLGLEPEAGLFDRAARGGKIGRIEVDHLQRIAVRSMRRIADLHRAGRIELNQAQAKARARGGHCHLDRAMRGDPPDRFGFRDGSGTAPHFHQSEGPEQRNVRRKIARRYDRAVDGKRHCAGLRIRFRVHGVSQSGQGPWGRTGSRGSIIREVGPMR